MLFPLGLRVKSDIKYKKIRISNILGIFQILRTSKLKTLSTILRKNYAICLSLTISTTMLMNKY